MATISRDRGPRSSVDEFDKAIERAAKVLKGSDTRPTPQNISRRAAQYLHGVGHQALLDHIETLPSDKRSVLGILS